MARINEVNRESFQAEVLESSVPVLVDFYADWCGPCRAMAPVLDRLASELGDSARIVKVNVDDEPGLAQAFGIRSIPTLIVVHGKEVVDRNVGMVGADRLQAMLATAASRAK
jgi:thioredoxin 1